MQPGSETHLHRYRVASVSVVPPSPASDKDGSLGDLSPAVALLKGIRLEDSLDQLHLAYLSFPLFSEFLLKRSWHKTPNTSALLGDLRNRSTFF